MALSNTFLNCSETPLWLPNGLSSDAATLDACTDCSVRLISTVPGDGTYSVSADGIVISENPLTSLRINGISHTLLETRLTIPGAHYIAVDDGSVRPADAELQCYFRTDKAPARMVCLVLPVQMQAGGNQKAAMTYFDSLGKIVPVSKDAVRPTVGALFEPDATYIDYIGADMRYRNAMTPRPNSQCAPVGTRVRYIVSTVATAIRPTTLSRLTKEATKAKDVYKGGPPLPERAMTKERMSALLTRVDGIRVVLRDPKTAGKKSSAATKGSVPLKAVKCHRLDAAKDIQGDRIYVGGKGRPGTKTLDKELQDASDLQKGYIDESAPLLSLRTLETIIAVVLGVVLAFVVGAYVLKFVLAHTNRPDTYVKAIQLYKTA